MEYDIFFECPECASSIPPDSWEDEDQATCLDCGHTDADHRFEHELENPTLMIRSTGKFRCPWCADVFIPQDEDPESCPQCFQPIRIERDEHNKCHKGEYKDYTLDGW